jgi:hypothetical protein
VAGFLRIPGVGRLPSMKPLLLLWVSLGLLVVGASVGLAQQPSGLQKQIVSMEAEGLDCLKSGDLKHFGDLTADDAIFLDDHGPADKATVLKNVTNFKLLDYSMENIQFRQLTRSSGLITYKIHEHGRSHGYEFHAAAYVTSIWARRGRSWVCTFSQETGTK